MRDISFCNETISAKKTKIEKKTKIIAPEIPQLTAQ